MADNTHIEWTDATWNPITGCSVVSPGCTNCYAMRLAGTRLQHHSSRAGLTRDTKAGPVWTGEVRLNEGWLDQPLRWRRPRRIFVCAHGDLFHESVPDAWIDQVFAVMALCPQHTFQVLTKRSARMRDYCATLGRHHEIDRVSLAAKAMCDTHGFTWDLGDIGWRLPNVWLGVSVEDQRCADARIPDLLATPAAKRFVSVEPMLEGIRLDSLYIGLEIIKPLAGVTWYPTPPDWPVQGITARHSRKLDWVIVGGESGPDARPMHPDWVRGLRDQCQAAAVPFFFKQWGAWAPTNQPSAHPNPTMARVGKAAAGALLDGREWREMPA